MKIEAEIPILWPPHAKSWLIGKDPDAGRDWGQEEKGMTEDEMTGWHHWLDGRESEWAPGVGAVQGGLACCDSWGHKESDRTERLNWTELNNHLAIGFPSRKQCLGQNSWGIIDKPDHDNIQSSHSVSFIAQVHRFVNLLFMHLINPTQMPLQSFPQSGGG